MEHIIRELRHAAETVTTHLHDGDTKSLVSLTLAFAQAGARDENHVAWYANGQVFTGTPSSPVTMLLTAMRFDPSIRSVGVLTYSPGLLAICEKMLLDICSFNRTLEPPENSTIDWGVAFCCEHHDGVPDVIYDTGSPGKVPLIRIFGENPTLVTASINRILTRIMNTNLSEE